MRRLIFPLLVLTCSAAVCLGGCETEDEAAIGADRDLEDKADVGGDPEIETGPDVDAEPDFEAIDGDREVEEPDDGLFTCAECHTSKDNLKADLKRRSTDHVYEGGGGCGGAISRLEPTKAVFVKEDFVNSLHGGKGCTGCHGGVEPAASRDEAHTGDFAVHVASEQNCSPCHRIEINNMPNSLHVKFNDLKPDDPLFVERAVVHVRRVSDDATAQRFLAEGIERACAECHRATCGSCHITLPGPAHGGFPNTGHIFYKTPNIVYNCTACHGGRKGKEFLLTGVKEEMVENTDLDPIELSEDVHYSDHGMGCSDCHPYEWMHNTTVDQNTEIRHENSLNWPTCEQCHVTGKEENFIDIDYHAAHGILGCSGPRLQCQICHSQPYPNCMSCHLSPEDEGEPPADFKFYTFKIGRNPFHQEYYRQNHPTLAMRYPYEYALVRRPAIVPDTFDGYGDNILGNYTLYPTWKYATPHNIQRTTMMTRDGCSGCHDNGNYYLSQEYLEWLIVPENFGDSADMFLEKELEANAFIIMTNHPFNPPVDGDVDADMDAEAEPGVKAEPGIGPEPEAEPAGE